MKSTRALGPALLVFLLLAVPAFAGESGKEAAKKPEVEPASDKVVKHELEIFDHDFDTVDIDYKLKAVKRLGKCVHRDVVKKLLRLLFHEKEVHVRAEAARGLAHQVLWVKEIGRKTLRLLKDDKLDPKIQEALIRTYGDLDYTKAWDEIADRIWSEDDEVTVACFEVFGKWKELRPWRDLLVFWEMYPEEGKWATGSVRVDTGASGGADAAAAKAKWKAKYGKVANQRPRPRCVKALKAAVKEITGKTIEKPEKFREWCRDHKKEIKAAERKRD